MFYWIFWGVGAALALLLCMGGTGVSLWWLLPLTVAFFVGLSAVFLLYLYLSSLLLPKNGVNKDNAYCRFMLVYTLDWLMRLLRVKIVLSGEEKLPADTPFLLVGNHRSDFDPMTTIVAMRRRKLAFVSKPENFKIPVAGRYIRCTSFLPIDREHPRRAVETIRRAAEIITDQRLCVGIYPEGTRSKTGELLEFHNGAFKIAQKAGAPIAVMSVRGTEQLIRNLPFRRTVVHLDVLQVLDADMVKTSQTRVISERVRQVLQEELDAHRG